MNGNRSGHWVLKLVKKVKFTPLQSMKAHSRRSMAHPSHFTPGRGPATTVQRLGGPLAQSQQVHKASPPPGFNPQNVQPIASHYTNHTIPIMIIMIIIIYDEYKLDL
jgi:hypothetical protein